MGQYRGRHHTPSESTTESMQCAGIGPAHVNRNGAATVQLWVAEGFLDEEPGAVILTLSDDQRRSLVERLKEPA